MTSNFLIVEKSQKTPAKVHIIFKISKGTHYF